MQACAVFRPDTDLPQTREVDGGEAAGVATSFGARKGAMIGTAKVLTMIRVMGMITYCRGQG